MGRRKTITRPRAQLILRMDEKIHRRLKSDAALLGMSLNDYVMSHFVPRHPVRKVSAAERKKIESLSSPE